MSRLLVTGGAGFVGSALIRQLIEETDSTLINVDSLTYAGNLDALADVEHPEWEQQARRRQPPAIGVLDAECEPQR